MRWLWLLLAVAACARSARPDPALPLEPDQHLLDEQQERPPPPTPLPGSVRRDALDDTLAAGPGALLSRVRVEAVRGPRGFRGWRLLSLPPNVADLQPGDVLTRVNGKTLERPEHLSALFDSLRDAPAIVVESERDGAPRTVHVPVVE